MAKHWQPLVLATMDASLAGDASRRPPLVPGEALLQLQRGVGLYDGATRSARLDSGACWATTHRIVWLHDDPSGPAVFLSLERIKDASMSGGFGGKMLPSALKSSPKISLTLYPESFEATPAGPNPTITTPPSNPTIKWKCTICDSMNPESLLICDECGVKRDPSTQTASNVIPPPKPDPIRVSPTEKSCPFCTFINHSAVIFCEACESRFPDAPQDPPINSAAQTSPLGSQSSVSSTPTTTAPESLEDSIVKISFRGGGVNEFYKVLKASLAAREWEKSAAAAQNAIKSLEESTKALNVAGSGGGISGIIKKADQSNKVLDQTLSSSFQDLDALMSKASEMVKVAESINSRLAAATSGTHSASSTLESQELAAFRSFLVDLGIPSPVTKEMTGDAYTQELAKELSTFLHKILPHYGHMLALTDLYCLFNRARGVALISPQDLHKSTAQFEKMGLPFRLRRFDSGLLVVHSSAYSDDAIAT
ncbi:hypothetical protein HDU98_001561, partial [Podochytrium sp. JEL0797]